MRSRFTARILLALSLMAAGLPASAAVPDRVGGHISDANRVALAQSVHPKVAAAFDMGAVAESRRLEGMTLRFSMTDAQQAELTRLLADQQDPASPQFRKWLTPQDFGAQFGLSGSDVAQASAWLTAKGFSIDSVANSSTFIRFSGTVGQVQAAFGTSIRQLSVDGETHIANVTELSLPRGLAAVVGAVTGISDFRLKPHHVRRAAVAATAQPHYTITTSGGVAHDVSPADFATIYDLNPLLTGTPAINGAGVGIAVLGMVDIYQSDIAAFRTASGLTANAPTVKLYGSDPGYPTGTCLNQNHPSSCNPSIDDLDESELDVEWAGATAPSAHITFVTSTDVIGTSLVNAIDDNLAPIVTVSYGGCENTTGTNSFSPYFTQNELNAYSLSLQQANAQGMTVLSASGDAGATDCDDSGVRSATQGLWVDFPASSPYVTGVGGTQFADSSGTYWNSTNGSNGESAISYIPEAAWNDTAASLSNSGSLLAAGGGASVVYPKPAWQTGTGVPSDGHRDVPDVSVASSVYHDASIICVLTDCTHGFLDANNTVDVVGGTSVAAPSFAGILALLEQKLGGARLGNVNPYLYSLASGSFGAQIFHDVTTGDNKSPCTTGSPNCPSGGSIGYSATAGYDLATGLGSVDAFNFVTNFASATLQKTTTTTVTFAPANPIIGQNVIFTATIAPSSGAAVPTGTVSFSINGGTATSVAVNSAGTATFTTSFNTGGAQTLTAVYSGDANFYGSTGTAATTVVVTSGVPTTTALTANKSTVTLTGSLTLTATVSSTTSGTLAGTVTFMAGSTALSAAPVALVAGSGGNTGTAVLTLTVSAASLPIGTDSITATFNGGGTPTGAQSYLQSTSAPLLLTVTNPTIAVTATNITMADGSSGTSTVTVASGGGYAGTVTLVANAAAPLSTYGGATFSPATITVAQGASGTSVLTISTPAASASLRRPNLASIEWASVLTTGGGLSLAGMMFLGWGGSRRRRLPGLLLSLLVFGALASVMGCGSSSTTTSSFSVPKGTYSVSVTATDNATSTLTGTTTFTLTLN